MSEKLLKVSGYDGLYRNPKTGVILNTDPNAKRRYHQKKSEVQRQKAVSERLDLLESKFDNLNTSVNMILEILKNGKSAV